ncbi:MAG: efflux RND transporter periplasmic adaptor subunit [Planctomycetota bacterium]|nr:efflux RND transporter periplasmic adaptor subunit [Planctomycetota bacterium]MDA1137290.1 efflux RND transporter periplasmic adaptor subunit [Planctomycetota bacterium]
MKDHRQQFQNCFVTTALLLALAVPAFAQGYRAEGVTEPKVDEQISSVVRGLVGRILVEEGQQVKKDDLIIELRKELEALETLRRKVVWESKLELKAAEDRLENVKQDLDATRRLYHSTRSISKEKLLEKELEFKLALADFERQKVSEELQEIEYKISEEQLLLREIRSPIDGVITKLFHHVGEIAEPGQPLFRIVDTKSCQFVSHIEARAARSLKEGEKVRLEVEAGDKPAIFEGTISFVSPTVDAASGLQEIKVKFDNSKGEIRPGVAARMFTGEKVLVGLE